MLNNLYPFQNLLLMHILFHAICCKKLKVFFLQSLFFVLEPFLKSLPFYVFALILPFLFQQDHFYFLQKLHKSHYYHYYVFFLHLKVYEMFQLLLFFSLLLFLHEDLSLQKLITYILQSKIYFFSYIFFIPFKINFYNVFIVLLYHFILKKYTK